MIMNSVYQHTIHTGVRYIPVLLEVIFGFLLVVPLTALPSSSYRFCAWRALLGEGGQVPATFSSQDLCIKVNISHAVLYIYR